MTPQSPAAIQASAATTSVVLSVPTGGLSTEVLNDIWDLAFHGGIYEVRMQYSTKAWSAAASSNHTWTELAFPPMPRSAVPNEPGVYIFLVRPNLFNLHQSSGLLYVGKATSLYDRVGAYMSEINKRHNLSRRPHIWRMINVWNGHLHYLYTTTATVADAENLETRILEALLPYFNKDFPAETSSRQRAFP
jgi:hypothetical protein